MFNILIEKILMFFSGKYSSHYSLPIKQKTENDYFMEISDSKIYFVFKPNIVFSEDYSYNVNYRMEKNLYEVLRNMDVKIILHSNKNEYYFKIYFKNKDDLNSFLKNDKIEGKI